MNPAHTKSVQQSWALIDPIADLAAELFYTNLFAQAPAMRPLFDGDLDVQGARLMAMMGRAIQNLDEPAIFRPMLAALGTRHHAYGVTDTHYEIYGRALLQTLAQSLGIAYTPEVNEAWTEVYASIRAAMVSAATEAA